MSQSLLTFLPTFPDLFEQGAYWLFLLLAGAVGFLLAWGIQSSRRRRIVLQLWELHRRKHREAEEECRLLAEDLALEQASQLAYQARRIAQLKQMLAHYHAGTGARQAATGSQMQVHDRSGQQRPAAQPAGGMPPGLHRPAVPARTSAPGGASAAAAVPAGSHMAHHGSPGVAAPPLRNHPGAKHIDPARLARQRLQQRLNATTLSLLKKRLALELRINREKARLLRHFEAEAFHWQQAHQASQARCISLAASIGILEHRLEEIRKNWVAAEREVERMRKHLSSTTAASERNAASPSSTAAEPQDFSGCRPITGINLLDSAPPIPLGQPQYGVLSAARRLIGSRLKDSRTRPL